MLIPTKIPDQSVLPLLVMNRYKRDWLLEVRTGTTTGLRDSGRDIMRLSGQWKGHRYL